MNKPHLIVVTGRPGAGKTTFSRALGSELFMPVVSRDAIKEGYVHTFGKGHAELPPDTNGIVSNIFFDALKMLVSNRVSTIAEAAFQHKIWSPGLEWFLDKARVSILICTVDEQVALDRFLRRGLTHASREYFHGDPGIDRARKGFAVQPAPYDEPHLDVPTFHVDTSGEYVPSVRELAGLILGR